MRAIRARSGFPIPSGNSSNRPPPGTAFRPERSSARGALALAGDRLGEHPPATLSPGHIALIELTYRAAHTLTTLNTEQLREGDYDELLGAARETMV